MSPRLNLVCDSVTFTTKCGERFKILVTLTSHSSIKVFIPCGQYFGRSKVTSIEFQSTFFCILGLFMHFEKLMSFVNF